MNESTKTQSKTSDISFKIKKIEEGSIIKGRIIKKKSQEVFVDLSPYGTGRLYGIFYLRSKDLINKLNEGDEVYAKIVGLDDGYGNFEIEIQNYQNINNWQKIKELINNNETIELEIKEANKGGLIVELEGVKGFVPVSQLAAENYPRVNENDKNKILEHLNKFVGKKMKLKIINFDPSNNKLILSERATKLKEYKEVLSKFSVGQIIDAEVIGVSSFGIFVKIHDNPQIDGLIHITEIPEKFKNIEETFKIGQKIKAQIIKVENTKVNLSLRYLTDDAWLKFIGTYKEGDIVEGLVLEKNSDIFATIETNGVRGITLNNLDIIEAGKSYKFKISKLEFQDKKLILDLVN